jgi:uncharacterized oligopeptide transporter (OPT) family protein
MFASFIAPGIYVLFASAYSCVNDISQDQCDFQVPSASAWRAIAVAVSDLGNSIPRSSIIFSAMLSTVGVCSVLIRHFVLTGRWYWLRRYHPNMMVVSMAFIIPQPIYAIAILIGALVAWYWTKVDNNSFQMFGYAVAAGGIAGEGIGGVLNAAIHIMGFGGEVYGTGIGCPGGVC